MSAPEYTRPGSEDDGEAWSLPSMGRASSDMHWNAAEAFGDLDQDIPIPGRTINVSLPTELQNDDALLPWSPVEETHCSLFSGASPSLDGYLMQPDGYLMHDSHGSQSPRRLHVHLNSIQTEIHRDGYSSDGHAGPAQRAATVPESPTTEPNYLSDSHLYPEVRQRKHVSSNSKRLRALPSLRRGDAGRRRTAVLERKSNSVMKHALSRGTVAPGQPSKAWRVRDGKFHQMNWKGRVTLEESMIASSRDVHVTAWCLGMGIDLPELYKVLVDRFGEDKVTVFPTAPDHVHPAQVSREFSGDLEPMQSSREQADFEAKQEAVDQANIIHLYYSDPNGHLRGEAVYAEAAKDSEKIVQYGSVVTWGIPIDLHSEVVFNLVGRFLVEPKDYGAIQADSMKVQVLQAKVNPTIRNDTMLLHEELFDQLEVRVGMSLALAQSTRLSMQARLRTNTLPSCYTLEDGHAALEELTMRIIERTKSYPGLLVKNGHAHIDEDDLSKTIGSVFLEKTELNLQVLSGPYNNPKFFSTCPDHVQKLYSLVSENFNLDDRAAVLNRRFTTLTDMLDLLRDQQSAAHEEHLSRIVIFLIFSTMCLGLLQILSTIFGSRFLVVIRALFGP